MQRWTTVVDVLIGLLAVAWVVVLATTPPHAAPRWVVPLALALLVTHRVLLSLERGSTVAVPREQAPERVEVPRAA